MHGRSEPAPPFSQRLLFGLLLAGCGLAFVIPLAIRCITMADEGYLLLQSLDMLEGKVLYRDMDAFVTPGIWFVLAGTFKIFGPSVLVSRIPVVLAYVCLIGLSYRITALVAGRKYGLATVAIMMACTVWAFPAWTFAFYSPFSVLFGLAALERLLCWRGARADRDLILAGLSFGLSILFKQNYGVLALIGGCFALMAFHLERREALARSLAASLKDAIWLAAGVAGIAIPCVLYLASQGVLATAFESLVIHPFEFSGKHDIEYVDIGAAFHSNFMTDTVEMMTYAAQPVYRTPMPGGWVGDFRLIERLHVLLYWFPPLIFILGLTMALIPGAPGSSEGSGEDEPPIDGGLLAVVCVSFFLFLGVFPRADFNHLINVYQPVVIAGVVSWAGFVRSLPKPRGFGYRVGAVGMLLLLSAYFAVAAYWYRGLVQILDTEVAGPRGGVRVSPLEAASINFVLENVDRISDPSEALLTIPDIAMLNFLSARPMPSPYYNLYEHHIAHDGGAAVVAGAEKLGVSVAVTRLNNFFSDRVGLRDYAPLLTEYLDTNFKQIYTVGNGDYIIYDRLVTPLPVENFHSILDDCDWKETEGDIVDHLLYRTVYQNLGLGTQLDERSVETRCRVRVPPAGGELVWRFDYRKPIGLPTQATLRVDVLARSSGVLDTLSLRLCGAADRSDPEIDPQRPGRDGTRGEKRVRDELAASPSRQPACSFGLSVGWPHGGFASASSSSAAAFVLPASSASCRAVLPLRLTLSVCAPFSRRILILSIFPFVAAA